MSLIEGIATAAIATRALMTIKAALATTIKANLTTRS